MGKPRSKFMSIRFLCPRCKKSFSVDNSYAGKRARCKCGFCFKIPLESSEATEYPSISSNAKKNNIHSSYGTKNAQSHKVYDVKPENVPVDRNTSKEEIIPAIPTVITSHNTKAGIRVKLSLLIGIVIVTFVISSSLGFVVRGLLNNRNSESNKQVVTKEPTDNIQDNEKNENSESNKQVVVKEPTDNIQDNDQLDTNPAISSRGYYFPEINKKDVMTGIVLKVSNELLMPTEAEYNEILNKSMSENSQSSKPKSRQHVKIFNPNRFTLLNGDGRKFQGTKTYLHDPDGMCLSGVGTIYCSEPYKLDEFLEIGISFEVAHSKLLSPLQIRINQDPWIDVPFKETSVPDSQIQLPKFEMPNLPKITTPLYTPPQQNLRQNSSSNRRRRFRN